MRRNRRAHRSRGPQDIYHAVVSSSFDADRLDYLRRDRLMTGTGAGAIHFDWLMEHVRVREIAIEAADAESDPERVPTFCLDAKALPAAEQFLLARYTLHEQVYFHKTTRCIEQMIAKLLRAVAELAGQPASAPGQTGLDGGHPLLRFFAADGATLANYLALDDVVVMGAMERMAHAADLAIAGLATRLRERRLYKTLDLRAFGHDEGRQRQAARRIDRDFDTQRNRHQGRRRRRQHLYPDRRRRRQGPQEAAHPGRQGPREITEMSRLVAELGPKKQFTRYYFENESIASGEDAEKGAGVMEREDIVAAVVAAAGGTLTSRAAAERSTCWIGWG